MTTMMMKRQCEQKQERACKNSVLLACHHGMVCFIKCRI